MIVTEVVVVPGGLTNVLYEPLQVLISVSDLLRRSLDMRCHVGIACIPGPVRPRAEGLSMLCVVLDPMGQEHLQLLDQLTTLDRVLRGVLVMVVRMLVVRIVMVVMMMSRIARRGFLHRWRCAARKTLRLLVDQYHAPAALRAGQRRMLPTAALKTHSLPPILLSVGS